MLSGPFVLNRGHPWEINVTFFASSCPHSQDQTLWISRKHKVYVKVSESKTNKENRLGVKAQYVKWLKVENTDGNDALKMSGRGGWREMRCKEAIKSWNEIKKGVFKVYFYLFTFTSISSTSNIILCLFAFICHPKLTVWMILNYEVSHSKSHSTHFQFPVHVSCLLFDKENNWLVHVCQLLFQLLLRRLHWSISSLL